MLAYCQRSFATWDVMLPSEELAVKLTGSNVSTKYFRLQPEYKARRRIRVTVCNVPIELNGDALAAYLGAYGRVEEVTRMRSTVVTTHGDYIFNVCLNNEGFQAIRHIITYQRMIVIGERRRPLCWSCKQ